MSELGQAAAAGNHLGAAMRAWRRHLHTLPELGFEESETAKVVADELERLGLAVHRGIGGTGVVGELKRGGERGIAFRAELDALAIEEKRHSEYRSRNPGRMHACGHDGHMAMLLGGAHTLASDQSFKGTVYFIFQPAEEHGRGAEAMLADGLLERFPMSSIFALHNWPTLQTGAFAVRPGPMMASEHNFTINVCGRGGHSSSPHTACDPVVPAAEIICALQTIVSRRINARHCAVVSVTEIVGDGARNAIPDTICVRGDFRTLEPSVSEIVETSMREIVGGVCAAHGVHGDVVVTHDFAISMNDETAVAAAARAALSVAGPANVDTMCAPVMASDDFGKLAQAVPGAYVLIGNGGEADSVCGLHNSNYDFNDDLLERGAAFWAALARQHFHRDR